MSGDAQKQSEAEVIAARGDLVGRTTFCIFLSGM